MVRCAGGWLRVRPTGGAVLVPGVTRAEAATLVLGVLPTESPVVGRGRAAELRPVTLEGRIVHRMTCRRNLFNALGA